MCGLGLEIRFIFDKSEPSKKFLELKHKYNFDDRNGLNLIMTGQDMYEVAEDNGYNERLIRMLEKNLNIDLSILDYWNYCNDDENDDFIDLDLLLSKLFELKNNIENNPSYYKKIIYGFDIENDYLKEGLLNDINYLIERINFNIENGAKKVRFETL